MSGTMPSLEEVVKIADPGEINRKEHLWGDRIVVMVGNVFAWLFPILMVAIVTQVVIRKMGNNQAWLDDLQWWLYGVAMMIGFAYAITTNSHVRVDIFHASFSREKQAKIELFGLGWLLLPFLALMFDVLLHYSWASFIVRESSDSPTGLQGLWMLKVSMPVLFVVAILATLTAMTRFLSVLRPPTLFGILVAGLPAFLFAAYRSANYALWWYVRFTQPELKIRKIAREPLLDNAMWIGVAIVALLLVVSYIAARRRTRPEG
ncbi:MAG: TRAP transporter permease DctQ [Rhodobacteraceae bacterium]|nr:MAG: TRAP transporter permease DctQ [Paracoccaceae bacterium]